MEFRRDLVDCAIIKVDIVRNSTTYENNENTINFGYNYSVRIKDIEKTVNFITSTFANLGIPCSRIYLSGFALLTESSIWNEDKITSSIENAVNQIKTLEQTYQSNKLIKKTR